METHKLREKMVIDYDSLPEELKPRPQWVVWRAESRNGKVTKVPVNPHTGGLASSTDPTTWCDYEMACRVFRTREDVDGLGFVFTADDPYTGVDLDKCCDYSADTVEEWAVALVERLNSYTEASASGTGLHILVKGVLPAGPRRKGRIEMYDRARYFTMTGWRWLGAPASIEDRQVVLNSLHAELFAADGHKSPPAVSSEPVDLTDQQILEKMRQARNGAQVDRLWRGDWRAYPSPSEADAAFCSYLAFWAGGDVERIDRLFRQSGLYRPKWDQRHAADGRTYGQITMALAVRGTHEVYDSSNTPTVGPVHKTEGCIDPDEEEADDRSKPLAFPEAAWRGPFADYRNAMNGTSEAPDSAHFAALWAVAAALLRRRVSIYYAFTHYPNVFLVNYGPTGDSKTSAWRQALKLLVREGAVKLLRGVGSAEALGDWMTQSADGPPVSHLLSIEELATLLVRGGWEGSTLLSFFTETFDAPAVYEVPFRKNPVKVLEPTPTLFAGTTPEWFWKGMRELDIYGGFGNRLFFLTGTPKSPIPMPERPNQEALDAVRNTLEGLGGIHQEELSLDSAAHELWNEFYVAWKMTSWEPLTAAAVKRVPAYILKLAMIYACFERTGPHITKDQLVAAIKVGHYGAHCADRLMQDHRQHSRQGQCERRVLVALERRGLPAWKIHHEIGGRFTAQDLSLAIRSLLAAGAILEVGKTREHQPIFGLRGRRRTT